MRGQHDVVESSAAPSRPLARFVYVERRPRVTPPRRVRTRARGRRRPASSRQRRADAASRQRHAGDPVAMGMLCVSTTLSRARAGRHSPRARARTRRGRHRRSTRLAEGLDERSTRQRSGLARCSRGRPSASSLRVPGRIERGGACRAWTGSGRWRCRRTASAREVVASTGQDETRTPNASARLAASRPIRPGRRRAASSRRAPFPEHKLEREPPRLAQRRTKRSPSATRLTRESGGATASSAVAAVSTPGVFVTTTPWRRAASRSMLSTPTP